jgi:hypothetical protein
MRGIFLALLACSLAFAEESGSSTLTARQLYYKTRPTPVVKKTGNSSASQGVPTSKDLPKRDAEPKPVPTTEAEYLGIRYSIIDGAGGREMDPAKVFHNGDIFRLKLQANTDGYLYVLNQGTSGNWNFLFPSAEVENNNNKIELGKLREIPSGQNLEFDTAPGIDKLFVVLSKEREPDMERLLGSLKNSQGDRTLQAENRPPGVEVDGVRQKLTARDIRVQRLRTGSNSNGENAVYVAASRSETSRIVTEIALKHE